MPALLAYTDCDQLALNSGYHVLAKYLADCPRVVMPRRDPQGGLALFRTRVLRRLAFSRWCVGGSFDMEEEIERRIRSGYAGCVHYLWCDRDLAFLDRKLHPATHPLIGTFHQCDDILSQAVRRVKSLPRFAAIIVMSETQRAWLRSHGVHQDRIHRILHGVDSDYFKPVLSGPPDQFSLLSVGETRRNFSLLREVAMALREDHRVNFEVVGPANKREMFSGLPNVTFHTRLADAELLLKYQQTSCLLHLIENSTANNVVNEAMACGAPVIGERAGGLAEYVTDDCAIFCPRNDGRALVSAITGLAASRQRQQEMREAARTHALSLDWKKIAVLTEEVYRHCSR